MRRDEAANDLLSHILGTGSKQILELDAGELLNDSTLFGDALVEALFEFVQLSLLFVEILDKSPASLLHLMQSALEAFDDRDHRPIDLPPVLGMPDVVSNELLNGSFPAVLQYALVVHHLQLIHQSINVLYQNVITSDEHLFLLTRWLLLLATAWTN